MLLSELSAVSARVGATSARSEKSAHLADLLRRVEPDEIEIAAAFLSGRTRQGRIGIGGAAVRDAWHGAHADAPSLTLHEVDETFERIARLSGPGSAAERPRMLAALLRRATSEEADFLVRLLLGELRQGALAGLMEEALAKATSVPLSDVRRALMLAGEAEPVARAVLTEGRSGLERFHLDVFRPVQPMLAQPSEDIEDALSRLGEAALEWKLDGARIQVHKSGGEVRVYSRRLNEVTPAVPEVVEAVRALPARELILDGETIALRPDGTPLPFQITMRRFGRKTDVDRLRAELPLTPYFFDVLHQDGRDLFDKPGSERFAALGDAAPGLLVPRRLTSSLEEAEAFFDEAIRHGHEGLMAKAAGAAYEAGRRGMGWLKVKPAHTLDLVVLAAEWGHGRRSGWLSNIHLGARDPAAGGFVMLGKTFKGMTDEMLRWQTRRFQEIALGTDGYVVHLRPEIVAEISFNDVQLSPHYPAGLALRFARVKRYRPDKDASQADTIQTVRALHPGSR